MRIAAPLLILLAGCTDLALPGVQSVNLYGGAVTVQGPRGYCVDRSASDTGAGFAVLGGCALMTTLRLMPEAPGLITVQVGDAGSAAVTGAEDDVLALLRTPAGAGLLSRTGDASAIDIVDADSGAGIVLVEIEDSGAPLTPDLDSREWRVFMDLAGRLATVTLRGFDRAPLTRDAALTVMSDAVRVLRAANRAG